MKRRSFLKLGVGASLAMLLANLGVSIAASPDAPKAVDGAVVQGAVTYNAGWVINLEDRAALLELEESKKKALEAKTATQTSTANSVEQKPAKKSFSEKVQDWLGKAKSWF